MIGITLFVSLLAAVQGTTAPTPGRALFWSSRRGESTPNYRSQTSNVETVRSILQEEKMKATRDMIVTFCSSHEDTNDFFTAPHFAESIRGSEQATILPNVYHAQDAEPSATFCDLAVGEGKTVSVDDVLASLNTPSSSVQEFVVNLQAATEQYNDQLHSLLSQLHEKNALIVGLQDPQGPSRVAPTARGRYTRLLQESEETNYNPEGTEFTIYYQNTYLYLTPDILTGLLTFLFCTFVVLIGFSCLNQIQGPSTFVHVMPTLGKEG